MSKLDKSRTAASRVSLRFVRRVALILPLLVLACDEDPAAEPPREQLSPSDASSLDAGPPPGSAPKASLPTAIDDVEAAHLWVRTTYLEIAATKFWTAPPASRAYALLTVALGAGYGEQLPGGPILGALIPGLALPVRPPSLDRGVVGAEVARVVLSKVLVRSNSPGPLPRLLKETATALIEGRRRAGVAEDTIRRSLEHGNAVGEAVLLWAEGDGFRAERSKPFVAPDFPGAWKRTGVTRDNPIEPYWGQLRTYLIKSTSCQAAMPVPYSTDPQSAFYQEALAARDATLTLTADADAFARFWADEPGESGLPPGHWMNIATGLARQKDLGLAKTLELYLRVGLAVGDAFISCWTTKYATFLLRPVTYIRANIDPSFNTLLVTPPFPAYTSGHSTASAAAATTIEALLGQAAFTDRTGQGRFAPRSFASVLDAAHEASKSRVVAGIHFPMDITEGFRVGECIGALHASRFASVPRNSP